MSILIGRLIVISLLLLTSPSLFASQSLAMVTDLQGEGYLEQGYSLTIFAELKQNDRIILKSNVSLTLVYLRSGTEYQFIGPTKVQLNNDQPKNITGKEPITNSLLFLSDLKVNPHLMTQTAIISRSVGKSPKLTLLNLNDTKTIDMFPTFKWDDTTPSKRYYFKLFNDEGETILTRTLTGNQFKLPNDMKLKPDAAYTWSIENHFSSGENLISWGEFSLANENLQKQYHQIKKKTGSLFSHQLLFALWLNKVKLKDQAKSIWKKLSALRPDNVELRNFAK